MTDDWDALIDATHEPLSPEEQAAVDRIVAAVRHRERESTPIHDAALLAALDIDLEIDKARAYLAAIETGDDLIWWLGGDR